MTALGMVAAASLTACTGSSGPTPIPTTTTTNPSPSPSLTAAQQLQQLAALGTKAVYRATYVVRQKHPSSKATWRVWRSSNSLRVDVVTKHATATLIRTPNHTYACTRSGHKKRCFRASKGSSLPPPLRLLAAQLFSANVATLARASSPITVTVTDARPPLITCFAVTPRNKQVAIDKGEYCFTSSGVLTQVRYPNGNSVQSQHISSQPPTNNVFRPYASPTPIPG
jgi:hypothetical protein